MPKSVKMSGAPQSVAPASEVVVWDDVVPKLGLRIRQTRKTWIVQWSEGGRSRKQTLGRADEIAVEDARRLAVGLMEANRVARPAPAPSVTMEAFAQEFLQSCAARWKPSTLVANRKSVQAHIVPHLGRKSVASVTRQDVLDWQRALGCAAGTVNRSLAVLSGLMRHAEIMGVRPPDSNPCKGMRRHKSSFKARYLSDREWARLGAALRSHSDALPQEVGCIRFLALTGCRRGEAVGLRWNMIDGPRAALPDAKSGPRAIWLGRAAKRVLGSFSDTNTFVFGSGDKPLSSSKVYKLWRQIRQDAGITDVRMHDLRHSFACVAVNTGIDLRVVGGLLGHADLGTTQGYAPLESATVRKAGSRVGTHLTKTITKRRPRPKSAFNKGGLFEAVGRTSLSLPAFCSERGLDPDAFRTDLIAWRDRRRKARGHAHEDVSFVHPTFVRHP